MVFTFLGTGTSGGVPSIGCNCKVCTSSDPRDNRLRTAAMVETDSTRVIIDCGPDFRQQMLRVPFRKIDGVLITHIHYDHVAGIDDLRPFCSIDYPKLYDIDVYANKDTAKALRQTMPYCFHENHYPGIPRLLLHEMPPHHVFRIGDIEVTPFVVMHGQMPIFAYRIGSLAYITDMKTIQLEEMRYLEGVETLVVNALRFEKEHHSHQLVDDAISFAQKVGARRTFLVHGSHGIGLHAESSKRLPQGVQLAYDGQTIHF
ncbi:MAG: MBL fold metallo-hydrolase [Prevotella sp.]|nr:MBL fold metallo-hydrolase [Prevotella sp.]